MERMDAMRDIARRVEDMVRLHGRRKDIAITYIKGDDAARELSAYQRKYFGVMEHCGGEEYFFVYETPGNEYVMTRHLLYVVCVTADSCLTAARDLIDLCARKF